jgi:divalent metal cation (Fe/Co/Zn/Cd) transporter
VQSAIRGVGQKARDCAGHRRPHPLGRGRVFREVHAAAGGTVDNLPVAIGGSLLAALVSYYAAQYKLHVGRETDSPSLTADGHHSRMDTLTTGAVVVGLMGHAIGFELRFLTPRE